MSGCHVDEPNKICEVLKTSRGAEFSVAKGFYFVSHGSAQWQPSLELFLAG